MNVPQQSLTIVDDAESKGIWIPAAPAELVLGVVKARAEKLQIAPISIPGYWTHRGATEIPLESPPTAGEKVIMFFHGGAYVAHLPPTTGPVSNIAKTFLKECTAIRRTLSVDYRVSSAVYHPSNQFPAALLDGLAGYLYLVKMGFKEKDIIIMGDSAGANLGLALTMYLVHNQSAGTFPSPPGSLVIMSPWVDFSETLRPTTDPNSSISRFDQYDCLQANKSIAVYGAISFVGSSPESAKEASSNPYISPASHEVLGLTPEFTTRSVSFKGMPRTWIEVGGFETLLDQVRRLRDAMVEDIGEDLRYHEVDGAVHDHMAFDWMPTRIESYAQISKWIADY